MNEQEQVRIMETQLSNFTKLMEKMQYMSMMFDPDPMFTQRARDIVRGNISKQLKGVNV
jgi:hypothetical protein